MWLRDPVALRSSIYRFMWLSWWVVVVETTQTALQVALRSIRFFWLRMISLIECGAGID